MTYEGTGWRAFDPADPDLPPALLEMARPQRQHTPLGEVHIHLDDLGKGGSEPRVGGKHVRDVELLDMTIVELRQARRCLGDESTRDAGSTERPPR